MRTRSSLLVFAVTLATSAAALAQQPIINPYEAEVVPPSPAAATAPAPPASTDPAQPINPYAYPYGSGQGAYPAPYGGYQVPAQPAYPSYSYPAQPCCCDPCANRPYYYGYRYANPQPTYYAPSTYVLKPAAPRIKVRRFSLGVHGTAFGISQQVGGKDVILGGAGIQLRIRSKGRFGLELKQDFLGFNSGSFERQSYPFTFSLMLYIFPNQETRHFNLYFLAGFGGMWDQVKLPDPSGRIVRQDFIEGILQGGVGAELRWKWFALALDARAVGLLRDSTTPPGSYYGDIDGAPVPKKSWGIQGNAFVNFWF